MPRETNSSSLRLWAALVLGLLVWACSSSRRLVIHPDGLLRLTGTFSSLRVTDDGFFGMEIRIAATEEPLYEGVVQIGRGEICPPQEYGSRRCFLVSNHFVVPIEFSLDTPVPEAEVESCHFAIPGATEYSGSFQGELTRAALQGEFTFARSGKRLRVDLPRRRSHWDGDK